MNDFVSLERDDPDWKGILSIRIEEVQFEHDIIPNPASAPIHTNFKWLFPEQVFLLIERHLLESCFVNLGPIRSPMRLDA